MVEVEIVFIVWISHVPHTSFSHHVTTPRDHTTSSPHVLCGGCCTAFILTEEEEEEEACEENMHVWGHHTHQHMLNVTMETSIFLERLESFPQRTLPTRWFTNIQNKQRENLPNHFFTDNADLLFMFPACAWTSVEGEVKVGKVLARWMLLLMERKKTPNMNKSKTKLNNNLIRAAIPNK